MKSDAKVGTNLTEGPVLRGLLIFALPIVGANLIQQLYSLVDLMVIGQFVGSEGTVGVSTGGEVADLVMPVAAAFGTAGQVLIAQFIGAKKPKQVSKTIGTFLSLMMIMAFAFMFFTIIFCSGILTLLNCPEEAFSQARTYMIITAIGMPFIFGYNAICGILRGMGESRQPLYYIIIAAIVNIVLDIILVAGFRLEAGGTAVATVFSQLASFLASLIYLIRRRKVLDFEFSLSSFKLDLSITKKLLTLGIPQAARSLLVRLSMLWVNSQVNSFGLVASATNSVGNKLQKFLEVYTMGASQASGAMAGQNLGARKVDRAEKVIWYTCAVCTCISAVIAVLSLTIPDVLFGLFTADAEVLELGRVYLRIMIIHYFLSGFTDSFQAIVTASGFASLNFLIGVLDGVVCKIGLSVLFAYGFNMGVIGFFWGTALSRLIPSIVCFSYFISGAWKKRKLLSDD